MDARGQCKTSRDCHGRVGIQCCYGQSLVSRDYVDSLRGNFVVISSRRSAPTDPALPFFFDQRNFASRHGPTYHEQDGIPSLKLSRHFSDTVVGKVWTRAFFAHCCNTMVLQRSVPTFQQIRPPDSCLFGCLCATLFILHILRSDPSQSDSS